MLKAEPARAAGKTHKIMLGKIRQIAEDVVLISNCSLSLIGFHEIHEFCPSSCFLEVLSIITLAYTITEV